MKSVYLCGPISGLSYKDCTDWRQYVARHLASDITPLSPLRGKAYLAKEKSIGHSYEGTILSRADAITTRDRFDVMSCDMLIANFLKAKVVSIGSVIELGWADAFRKPVVLAMEPGDKNIHTHPIVDRICGFKVHSLDDAIAVVNSVLSMNFAKENQ